MPAVFYDLAHKLLQSINRQVNAIHGEMDLWSDPLGPLSSDHRRQLDEVRVWTEKLELKDGVTTLEGLRDPAKFLQQALFLRRMTTRAREI